MLSRIFCSVIITTGYEKIKNILPRLMNNVTDVAEDNIFDNLKNVD